MVHRQVAQHAGFDLYLLGVGFPLHLVAGFQLLAGHHAGRLKHRHAALRQVSVEDDRHARLAIQPAAGGFVFPLVAVAVAVEVYGFTVLDVFAEHFHDGGIRLLALGYPGVYLGFELL